MDYFTLNNNGITEICRNVQSFLIDNGVDRKEAVRNRLTIEETLIKFRDAFGENQEIGYLETKILGQMRITLSVKGAEFNPLEVKASDEDVLMDSLLSSYDSTQPDWKYKNSINQVVFSVSKPRNLGMLSKIAIAIVLGSLLGFLSRLLPNGIGEILAVDYVTPLAGAFVGLVTVMAVFLTFFAVSLGIAHTGNLSTLSTLSKTMLGRIGKIMVAVTLITTVALIPAITFENTLGDFKFKSAFDLLIDFIPSNPIAPLVNFNVAQLIIVAALFGFAMLYLGTKTATLESVFSECNLIAVNCNSWLTRTLIHIYVGMNFFILAAKASAEGLFQSLIIIVIVLIAFLILMIIYTIVACKRLECSPKKLIKRLMPTFIINLSSANYGSSFTVSIETIFECGTEIDYGSFGHNVGGFLFKPAYAIVLAVGTIMSAVQAGVTFNVGYMITIVILTFVLAISLPTIPGAAIIGFSLMFAQLGLPEQSLAIIVTLNALLDFFTVAVNGYCLQSEIMIGAKKAGRIDASKI